MENEVPQPHWDDAFGFSKLNVSPIISVFQSIVVPNKCIKLLLHTTINLRLPTMTLATLAIECGNNLTTDTFPSLNLFRTYHIITVMFST